MTEQSIPSCIIGDPWKAQRIVGAGEWRNVTIYPTDTGAFSAKELESLTGIDNRVIRHRIERWGISHKDVLNPKKKKGGFKVGHTISKGNQNALKVKRVSKLDGLSSSELEKRFVREQKKAMRATRKALPAIDREYREALIQMTAATCW